MSIEHRRQHRIQMMEFPAGDDNTPIFTWSTPYDASGIAGYYWKVDNGPET
ncbi:MAG: hypothetical protein QXH20_00015 [Candidatus Bathyarchaeia archaeon]